MQCDEIWSFGYAKQRTFRPPRPRRRGWRLWTWTALEADTKLILSYSSATASHRHRVHGGRIVRLANRVQLTTDGHKAYLEAVEDAFGADIDYASWSSYTASWTVSRRAATAPPSASAHSVAVEAVPMPPHVSTSYVERQNLTMRMQCAGSPG